MDLSIHAQGRQSRSRKTSRSFETQIRTRTERHLHTGREMDCVSLESARSDSRLCGRGESNEVKALDPLRDAAALRYVFSVPAAPVAQTCSLSVSVGIFARREHFPERGSVTRSSVAGHHVLVYTRRAQIPTDTDRLQVCATGAAG